MRPLTSRAVTLITSGKQIVSNDVAANCATHDGQTYSGGHLARAKGDRGGNKDTLRNVGQGFGKQAALRVAFIPLSK